MYHNLYQQNMLQTVLAAEQTFCEMNVGSPISMHICLFLYAYVHVSFLYACSVSQISIPVLFQCIVCISMYIFMATLFRDVCTLCMLHELSFTDGSWLNFVYIECMIKVIHYNESICEFFQYMHHLLYKFIHSIIIGLKMAETRRRTSCATTLNDRETRRKDRSKYHYRNRTC